MTPTTDGKILFTDYSYHNLGVPKNQENPFYKTFPHINPQGTSFQDLGLGTTTHDATQNGKFRVPTLRNVQYTGPYFHNGYFNTLREVIHFINTRDHGSYEAPEVRENIAHQFTGSLQLTDEEEDAIIAFLLTLSDGFIEVE
jgi:cytochrome c peroxidase